MTKTDDSKPSPPSLLAVAVLVALVMFGFATAPAAGARDGDFVHLWMGGHAWVSEGAAAIYAPEVHRSLLAHAFDGAPPESLWAARNDRFGAFFYPPVAAMFYGPLGLLPVHTAGLVHAVLSWLGVRAAAGLASRWLRLGPVAAALVVLTTPAFFHNHVLGQNGGWAFLVLAAGGWSLVRGRGLLAGLCLGLLVAKPSWLLAVGWLPFALGRRDVLLGLVGGVGLLVGISVVVVGIGPWQTWLALEPQLAALSTAGDYPLHLQYSLWGLARQVAGLGLPGDILGAALAGVVVVATARVLRRRPSPLPLQLALGFCAASLVNPHLHPYDVTGGVFAVLALWSEPRWRRVAWLALLVHHGGQALEGLAGSGLTPAPATVGLWVAWGLLMARLSAPSAPDPTS